MAPRTKSADTPPKGESQISDLGPGVATTVPRIPPDIGGAEITGAQLARGGATHVAEGHYDVQEAARIQAQAEADIEAGDTTDSDGAGDDE